LQHANQRKLTFAAIGRTLIQDLLKKMSPEKAHSFRSVVGRYIEEQPVRLNWPKCSMN
jgi:hypothetical protein